MFFKIFSPRSVSSTSRRPCTFSWAVPDMQTPPGDAIVSRRAAILTPSPIRSSPSTRTSPRWIPIRYWSRWVSGRGSFRRVISACTASAQATAATTDGNSTRNPSPIVLNIRPPCSAMIGCGRLAAFAHGLGRSRLVLPHHARIADDVGRKDRSEAARHGHAPCLARRLAPFIRSTALRQSAPRRLFSSPPSSAPARADRRPSCP